jgi:hypothetical protein
VAAVLASPELRALWEQELGQMRERIKDMRKLLAEKVHARVPGADFSFVTRQRGMFSYTGLTKEQVDSHPEQHDHECGRQRAFLQDPDAVLLPLVRFGGELNLLGHIEFLRPEPGVYS